MGSDHFGTGRVLDTLGMVYAGRDNFHAAEEFFQQAIARKSGMGRPARPGRQPRQPRPAHLEWGNLERAEACFLQDLAIARTIAR